MIATNNYALLIGVQDYSTYDRSVDHPKGTSDVPGALNDVRAWFRQCLALGFSPDRIRILTSPKLSPKQLGPGGEEAMLGEATREAIIDGIGWLSKTTAAVGQPAAGLVTFSGHGEQDGGLLLCPSDVTGSLDEAIDITKLRAALGCDKDTQSLTFVLDACHAQVGADPQRALRVRLRTLAAARAPLGAGSAGVEERILGACRLDQSSASSTFGGETMGAFTWALTSAIGQWRVVREGNVARLTASYGTLVSYARALLSALKFDQVPTLSGPPNVGALPFLRPGDSVMPGETSEIPDAHRALRQLDGGQKDYRLYHLVWANTNVVVAKIIVANNAGTIMYTHGGKKHSYAMAASMEYWFVISSQAQSVQNSQSGASLKMVLDSDHYYSEGQIVDLSASGYTSSDTSKTPSGGWQQVQSGASWPQSARVFQTSDGADTVCFNVQSNGSNYYFSTVTWYQPGSSALNPGGLTFNWINAGSTSPTTGQYRGAAPMNYNGPID